jgi:HPt (histidine-containing phosphotransfer) domain-containing protein
MGRSGHPVRRKIQTPSDFSAGPAGALPGRLPHFETPGQGSLNHPSESLDVCCPAFTGLWSWRGQYAGIEADHRPTFGRLSMVMLEPTTELVPARQRVAAEPAIDTVHLARMTLGERSLEREVLALFDRQADLLLPRIRGGVPALAAASAHTLKGSALGIGAFRVARAAEAVEQAKAGALAAAVELLTIALDEAKAEIARMLAN